MDLVSNPCQLLTTVSTDSVLVNMVISVLDVCYQFSALAKSAPEGVVLQVCTLADLYNGTKKNVAVNKRRINYEGLEEDFTKNYLIHVEP